MTKNNQSTPQNMSATDKQNGKSGSKSPTKKRNPSKCNVLLVSESSLLFYTALTVSFQLLTDFLLAASSPSLLSVASKTSSLSLTTSNIKKRLILDSPDNHRTSKPKKDAHRIKSMMNEELKLAAYNVDWIIPRWPRTNVWSTPLRRISQSVKKGN